jgi:hypothetical protein
MSDLILSDTEVETLRALVERVGDGRAAEHLQLSVGSVLRLLGRRPARRGTLAQARIALAKAVR